MKFGIVLIVFLTTIFAHILNAQPEVEWIRLYGDNDVDQFFAHVRTEDGGWAFAGCRGNDPDNNSLVVTDVGGEIELFDEYNIDAGDGQACDLVQTEDGGYLLAGTVRHESIDASAFRIDANGNEVWGRLYGGNRTDTFRAVASVKDDRFILAGYSSTWIDTLENGQIIRGGYCGYLCFIEGNGEIIWQNIYGGVEDDWLEDVIVVEDGFVAVGKSENFDGGETDLWLLRVDEDGREIWSLGFGNDVTESGYAVIRTAEDNGFAIAGHEAVRDPDNQNRRFLHPILLKLDEEGNEIWLNRYEIEGLDVWINDVVRTPDDSYALVGWSKDDPINNPLNSLAFIMCIESDANLMWQRSDGIENGQYHEYQSAVLDDDGGITASGWVYGNDLEGVFQGLFAKIAPSNLPPHIFERNPEDSITFVLQDHHYVFSVDARDPEGAELSYEWILEEEVVGEEELVVIEFPECGDFNLRVDVTDGTWTTSAGWLVHVFSMISGHSPVETRLTVPRDTSIHFEVQTDVEDDSLTFMYTLDGDPVGENPSVDVTFEELGENIVQVDVFAHGCCDSVTWWITVVNPDEVVEQEKSLVPYVFHHSFPNPFNESTTIRFNLLKPQHVRATVHDLTGQEVAVLTDMLLKAGDYSLAFDGRNLSAGLYYYRITGFGLSLTGKCVLVK